MRSLIGIFLILLAVTFTFALAQAQTSALTNSESLADILSPDEVAAEMGFDVNQGAQSPIHFFDEEDDVRLKLVIDKSLQGTSPTAQSMQIILDGQVVDTIQVSTGREKDEVAKSGRHYFSRTPTGTFKIFSRERHHWSVTWQADMAFAEFFNGGVAVHATVPEHYKELGTRASGGCVRVTLDNAKKIWELIDQVGVENTRIIVFDTADQ